MAARRARKVGVAFGAVALMIGAAAGAGAATGPSLVRVNLGIGGVQANDGIIDSPSISADGRYVAFASAATNLVSGDTNGWIDIFVRDRQAGTTSRVSVSSTGTQANGSSFAPVISADGRYVAYDSYASNISGSDRNSASGGSDVFLYDMAAKTTTRVSIPNGGGSANGESAFASISGNGRYVAYDSTATNLVAGDTNGFGDVFVWDRTTGKAVLASVATGGAKGNGGSGLASISADGSKVAFLTSATSFAAGDDNGYNDVYVRDLAANTTVRASLSSSGAQGNDDADNPVISADGSHVAFDLAWPLSSEDTDWTQDVYVRDLGAGTTAMASAKLPSAPVTNVRGDSYDAALSADGRYVAFSSYADDLLDGDLNGYEEVYVRDMSDGSLRRIAVNGAGVAGTGNSYGPAMSGDAAHFAFAAAAENLVELDSNGVDDVFVYEPAGPGFTVLPDTTITSGPAATTKSTSATFTFTSNVSGATFRCRMDTGAWTACTSPTTRTVAKGKHTFAAQAVDAAGNADATPATWVFTVK